MGQWALNLSSGPGLRRGDGVGAAGLPQKPLSYIPPFVIQTGG